MKVVRCARVNWRIAAICVLLSARASGATAQAPAGPIPPIYTNKTSLTLPIQIEPVHRPHLREVVLFVKQGAASWVKVESASPSQGKFVYVAPQDGEYWFSVATVDHNGMVSPPDVSAIPPGLKVFVDTRPPTFEFQVANFGSEPALRCALRDANPDYNTLKISYRASDGMTRELEQVPGQPGLFRIPGLDVFAATVRVSATDRAGNPAAKDMSLRDLVAVAPSPPGNSHTGGVAPARYTPAPTQLPSAPTALPSAPVATQLPPAPMESTPASTTVESKLPRTAPLDPEMPTGRLLIGSRQAAIDYRVEPVGPSGVSKVEVWMTADRGATWQRLGEDLDRRSPAEVTLPGDGFYGIRLAVTNGNGFGGEAPKPGDAPTNWVEVDTTLPVAQLRDVTAAASGGVIDIRWNASDRNLMPEPVQLYYAAKREGPWQPIVKNIKNDGAYRWAFPREIGGHFFIRMEVVDLAGNTTRCETPMPIALDTTEPRATVVGITGLPSVQNGGGN